MRCYYYTDKQIGRVLIPGCYAVVHSNDKSDCICPKPARLPKEKAEAKIKRLEERIQQLEILVEELSKTPN